MLALFHREEVLAHKCDSCIQVVSTCVFPTARSIMVVNFNDYKAHPESVVEEVLRFVNADLSKHRYKPLPAAMKVR